MHVLLYDPGSNSAPTHELHRLDELLGRNTCVTLQYDPRAHRVPMSHHAVQCFDMRMWRGKCSFLCAHIACLTRCEFDFFASVGLNLSDFGFRCSLLRRGTAHSLAFDPTLGCSRHLLWPCRMRRRISGGRYCSSVWSTPRAACFAG
jgi:hypothetical protein